MGVARRIELSLSRGEFETDPIYAAHGLALRARRAPENRQPADQQDHEDRDKDVEQDFRDGDRSARNRGKAKHTGDQADDQEHKCPTQHKEFSIPQPVIKRNPGRKGSLCYAPRMGVGAERVQSTICETTVDSAWSKASTAAGTLLAVAGTSTLKALDCTTMRERAPTSRALMRTTMVGMPSGTS